MQIRSTFEISALEAISKDDYYRKTGEINQGTLDATVAKNLNDATGDVGKMLLEFGFGKRNEDGTITPTEKGQDVLGPDFIANFVTDFTAKETALTSKSGAVGKDIVFSGALGRVMDGSRDAQDMAGAMSSDIFKKIYDVTGSIDETIKELEAQFPSQQQAPASVITISNLSADAQKNISGIKPGEPFNSKQGRYIMSSDGKTLIPVR